MLSSLNKGISLEKYKKSNEQFIYSVKGILRLPMGRAILYRMGNAPIFDFFTEVTNINRVECIFAVTDKRIILIPKTNEYEPISFNYGDIEVIYYDQLFDKVFLLNIKEKKLLNFYENKLVFSIYPKQNLEINKVNCILNEYNCS